MNLNATLILQSIAMLIFVWFCMKFVWPPLLQAMDARRERIAEGLAASDRAEKKLEEAEASVDQQIREAREKAGEIVDQAKVVLQEDLQLDSVTTAVVFFLGPLRPGSQWKLRGRGAGCHRGFRRWR